MKDSTEKKDIKQKMWDDWYLAQGLAIKFVSTQLEKRAHTTFEQFQVLSTMKEMGEAANATEMAKKLVKNTNTISTILDRMEQKGLAIKTRDTQDRRVVFATMTDKGRKRLTDGKKISRESIERLTAAFSQQELKTFNSLIERLIKTARKTLNEGKPGVKRARRSD